MHQPEVQRFLGRHDPFPHEEIHGFPHPHQLREQKLSPFVGQESETERRAAHTSLFGCNAEITRQGEREAGLNRHAVQRGNRQFVQISDRLIERL